MIEPPGQGLFRILGPTEVWTGRDWSGVGAPKWRAVIALLLLRAGQAVGTDEITAGLWGDSPPARAGNLVSVYVHRLRRLIGDTEGAVLITRSPGYQVVIGPDDLDAQRFARLAADGRRALAAGEPERASRVLTDALALWRGRALADVPASPLVDAEAGRLEESRLAALILRFEADLACGRDAEVAPDVRRLLADHPLREELWALLLRALHGAGRQAEALEAYARARALIADELGVDPGPQLQQIYQDILRTDGPGGAGRGGAGRGSAGRGGAGRGGAGGGGAGGGAGRGDAGAGGAGGAGGGDARRGGAGRGGAVPAGVGTGGSAPGGGGGTGSAPGDGGGLAVAPGGAGKAGVAPASVPPGVVIPGGAPPGRGAPGTPERGARAGRGGVVRPAGARPAAAGAAAGGPGERPPGAEPVPPDSGQPAPSAWDRHPSPLQPAPAQLPADLADFTGRDGHVRELLRLLSGTGGQANPEALPIVVVVGSGGLGKTALAIHAAHLLAAFYPDGQLYAPMLGVSQAADPADILARFLRALGADPARIPVGLEERAAQYRTRLAGRRVLIVLDDARDSAQVWPLLPGSASCAVLITSRGHLPEMVGSRIIDLSVLPPEEARALFARVAGEERAWAEPAATQDVLAACAGLPLAIRIAGARLAARGGWNVRHLATRLSDERRRLDELRAGNLAVRASFEVSFASLSVPSRAGAMDPAHAFRLLGVWTGPFITLPAAAALLGEAEDAVADALEVLVDAHLLDSPEPDQYRFHDLLRVYAADRARAQETSDERREAISRLLAWYLHTTEAAARVISPQRTQVPLGPAPSRVAPLAFASLEDALSWCEAERPCLVAATHLAAATGQQQIAWELPAAAMSFLYRRSHWRDWVSTHEVGLDRARAAGDRLGEAWMLNNLGMAFGQQRQPEAIECFERALALYRELGDARGESRAANNVAKACFDLGRFRDALDAGNRSLAIQRRAANRYGEGLALSILGCSCRGVGGYEAAIGHLEQSLAIFRELGDRQAEADALSDLGGTYLDIDQTGDALRCLADSLAIWQGIGNRYGQASTLRWLGRAWQRAGDPGQAAGFLGQALRLFEDLGDDARAAETRADLAGPGSQAV